MKKLRSALLAATAVTLLAGAARAGELEFSGIDAPRTDAARRSVNVSPSVSIDGANVEISYHTIARSGDRIGDEIFGALQDVSGRHLFDADGSARFSDKPDFTSLLPVGGRLFSVSHFEARPGAMYLTELKQDSRGNLHALSTRPIDFSSVGGLWAPCAGSLTPWNSHLGSEEYPPDARSVEEAYSYAELDDRMLPMARYFGVDARLAPIAAFKAVFQPYYYGFPVEVTVDESGNAALAKHYAMGRVAVELALVMPDEKTAYISEDGTNTGFYRFVADRKGDLSAGTLYAAKWKQTSSQGAGAADIEWIDLGHGTDTEVDMALKLGVKFSDIFETARFDDGGICPEGYSSSNAEAVSECLKVRPGMDVLASRLETRRYASMLGATTEFSKMEGIAFDPDGNRLFLSMSEVEKGMEDAVADNRYDKGGRNAVRLSRNACGAVYELALDDGFVVESARSFLEGRPKEYAEGPFAGSTCDIDGIANPDNLSFIPGYNTLIVGEDTRKGHRNDANWAVDAGSGKMTRIATTPYGAENTSVDWYRDVNGFGYLMTVVQHPYGESDSDKLRNRDEARAYVGYIGPFPVIGK